MEKSSHNKILCFSFSSEAWLRKCENTESVPDNWKSLPKIEVLITSYETPEESVVEINNIIREGKIANDYDELIDCVRLEKNSELNEQEGKIGGRFSTLFKDYLKSKK